MSVEPKTPHPFFAGSFQEIIERIHDASALELLRVHEEEPQEWGLVVLRNMMEKTPINEVASGTTPSGLHLHMVLLFNPSDQSLYDSALSVYGMQIIEVLIMELERVVASGVYPSILVEHLGDYFRCETLRLNACTEWMQTHKALSKFAQLSMTTTLWKRRPHAVHALITERKGQEASAREILRTCFALLEEFGAVLTPRILVELATDSELLPELRAAAFTMLYKRKEEPLCKELLLIAFPSFMAHPGNSAALHATSWRMARVVPPDAALLVGHQLIELSSEKFDSRDQRCYRRSYEHCSALRDAAIWNYFFNLPEHVQLEFLHHGTKTHFPMALAAMLLVAKHRAQPLSKELFLSAEYHAANLIWDESQMRKLMLMFDYPDIPGRPEWDDIKYVLGQFPDQVLATCVNIARSLRHSDGEADNPSAKRLVMFVKAACSGKTTAAARKANRKQIVEIRDWLSLFDSFPEESAELTNLIADLGIKEKVRK